MATLKPPSGQLCVLEPDHTIGRSNKSNLQIADRRVSSQHAEIRWNGKRWQVRDLGSRNGTFLDGERLSPGVEYPLVQHSVLAFGTQERRWELTSDLPPSVMLVPMSGGEPRLIGDDGLLAIPSSEDPQLTIYRSAEGHWSLENQDGAAPLRDQQTLEFEGQIWRFCAPQEILETSLVEDGVLRLADFRLTCSVSRDEEHVKLTGALGKETYDLGARNHNYLMLTLARKQLEDVEEGLPEAECGWLSLEDLEHDPSMSGSQLNMDVFRIRKQFAALGIPDAARVIERRPRPRQIRLGIRNVSVLKA